MNQQIFLYLNHLTIGHPLFSNVVVFCATTLGTIVIIVSILVYLFHKSYKKNIFDKLSEFIQEFSVIFISIILAWGTSFVLKYLFHSPRPYLLLSDVNALFMHGTYDSFPSGHATLFFALATSMYFYQKRFGAMLFVFAFVISISRIFSGVHFPVDILAGALIGVLIPIFVQKFFNKISTRRLLANLQENL
jgi:undecaprenyl-diphosphatase